MRLGSLWLHAQSAARAALLGFQSMFKALFVGGALMIAELASASDSHGIALTTQDANGFHIMTAFRIRQDAVAAIWRKVEGEQGTRIERSYPAELFDEKWRRLNEGWLLPYLVKDKPGDLGVADNYVISQRTEVSGKVEVKLFIVPKCGLDDAERQQIVELSAGLLPKGSPGKFRECGHGG